MKGWPSDHFTPERKWYVNVMPSALASTLVTMECSKSGLKSLVEKLIGMSYASAQNV